MTAVGPPDCPTITFFFILFPPGLKSSEITGVGIPASIITIKERDRIYNKTNEKIVLYEEYFPFNRGKTML